MRRFLTLALTTALLTALAAPAVARPAFSEKSDATIVQTALALSGGSSWDLTDPTSNFDGNDGDFDILINALLATGAIDLFDGTDWTVFAPTDAAFMAATGQTTEADAFAFAAANLPVLDILAYHLTDGVRNSRSVINPPSVEMLAGGSISVDVVGSDVVVTANNSSANIVLPDVRVADGIIHVIDFVLLP